MRGPEVRGAADFRAAPETARPKAQACGFHHPAACHESLSAAAERSMSERSRLSADSRHRRIRRSCQFAGHSVKARSSSVEGRNCSALGSGRDRKEMAAGPYLMERRQPSGSAPYGPRSIVSPGDGVGVAVELAQHLHLRDDAPARHARPLGAKGTNGWVLASAQNACLAI